MTAVITPSLILSQATVPPCTSLVQLAHAPVIDELEIRLATKSNRSGLQLMVRVVLPRTLDTEKRRTHDGSRRGRHVPRQWSVANFANSGSAETPGTTSPRDAAEDR